MWQKEVKVAAGMKVTNQLTLNRKGILHYLFGCNVIPKVLKVEAGSKRGDLVEDVITEE